MAWIDTFALEDRCSGSSRMVGYLGKDGIPISRDRMGNLLQRSGLRAIFHKPRSTVPRNPSEQIPYHMHLSQHKAVDQM